jgi:uncharacterized protein (TIGR02466 family)
MNIDNDQTQVTFVFPTAIYSAYPENKEKYIQTFTENASKYLFDKTEPNSDFTVLSGEYLGINDIHHNPSFEDFFKMIVKHASAYVDVLGVRNDLFDYYVNKSWLSIIQDSDHHMRYHVHSNSDISFVYYVEVPENADCISFANYNKPNELFVGMFDEPEDKSLDKTFFKERNTSNYSSYFFPPYPGLLMMFPGKLHHGTVQNPNGKQKGKRVAIVGDISLILKPQYKSFETGRMSLQYMRKFDN